MTTYINEDERLHQVREISTIKEMLTSGASLFGERPAFLVKKEKGGAYNPLTFRQVKEDVDALGTYMVNNGLKGEKIAIIGTNCYQWILAYFAVVCGGGIAVPLDKELTKEEIEILVKTADCKAVFYTDKYEKIFKEMPIPHQYKMNAYEDEKDKYEPQHIMNLVARGKILMEEGNRDYLDISIDPDVMAVILFTSGTTGVPKGVMLSNRNITSVLTGTSKIVQLREDEVALSVLPIHHTFESTMGIMVVFFQGGAIAFFEGLKYVLKNLQEAKASVLVGVPLIVESIYDKIWKQAKKSKKEKALRGLIKTNNLLMAMGIDKRRTIFKSVYKNFGGRLRLFICGAAALNPKIMRGFMDLGFDISQGYGLTETSPLVSGMPDFDRHTSYVKAGSCGPVLPGGEIKVVNPDSEGIGEIVYRGPNVMLGYYNMPEETAKVIKDGWFYTGDLGFIDENGWVYLTGRAKNVIVTKTGKNIYPEELELLLNRLPFVQESMVYGLEEEGGNDIIVAAQIMPDYAQIKEEKGEALSEEEIHEIFREEVFQMNNTLPNYKRVRNIIIRTDDFIKTTTKKIKRQENL